MSYADVATENIFLIANANFETTFNVTVEIMGVSVSHNLRK